MMLRYEARDKAGP